MNNFTPRLLKLLIAFAFSFSVLQASAQVANPTVSGNLFVCSGSSTTLTATGAAGASFAWYTQASGGTLLSSSAVYTPVISGNIHFYVEQTVGGITSLRTNVAVFVSAVPGQATATNAQAMPAAICVGASTNLKATVDASAGQYVYWYDAANGGNLLGTTVSGANFPVTPNINTTYYAQSQPQTITQTFNTTGDVQTFIVPAGVTSIQVDARGARGAYYRYDDSRATPGSGGRVQATMNVTPGQVLYIYVGGRGIEPGGYNFAYGIAGYNGGGYSYGNLGETGGASGGSGGGGTDIRINGQTLANRVLVAGGGGGATWNQNNGFNNGAGGGGLVGNAARSASGGTQTAGGTGSGQAGSLGQGGDQRGRSDGAGGGGGYYGGAGSSGTSGGGGGSSYTDALLIQNVIHTSGYQFGDGQVIITYQASANCAATTRQAVIVTVNPVPVVNAGNNIITCAGTPATLTASGADTYTWQPGALAGQSVSVTPAATTTYTVTGTAAGCSSTGSVTVTVTSVSVSANQTICSAGNATLSASGADSYTWQPGNLSGQSVNVSPTNTTVYTVTGFNNTGCSTTAQTTVTANPLPALQLSSAVTVSAGSNATFTASGADSYAWFPIPSSNTSITFIPAATTTVSVTGYYNATGCNITKQAVVTVMPLPAVAGNTNVCPGGTATLTATGTGPFNWYNTETGGTAVFTGAAFTTPATNAATTWWLAGSNGIRTAVNLTIAYPHYNAVATPQAICSGGKAALTITNATQTIRWYDAATGGNLLGTTANSNAFIASPVADKIYYAQLQAQPHADTFNITGDVQTFVVPAGVTSIQVDARGARGAYYRYDDSRATPGSGGRVQATMNVTPGQVLYIYVGGRGIEPGGYNFAYGIAGYNGGGYSYGNLGETGGASGGSGGGGTDIRINGQTLANRVLVAGGGGGATWNQNNGFNNGAGGGGLVGNAARSASGGTQTAGGTGSGQAGSLGQGGDQRGRSDGAGGGGGYYGGAGSSGTSGGGGGSSYTDALLIQNVIHTSGYQFGDGQVIISYGTANNCIITIPDTVHINSGLNAPSVTAGASALSVIAGKPVTLTVSGNASTYNWNNNVQTGVPFIPAATAFYVVTGIAANGCTSIDSVTVTVAQHIDMFAPATATQGTTVTITGGKFNGSTAVSFGGTPASYFNVNNDTTITASISGGTTGDVSVTTPGGVVTKPGFVYAVAPGSALSFNGTSQYVTANATTAIAGSYTVEAWVRPQDVVNSLPVVSTNMAGAGYAFRLKLQGGNSISLSVGDGTAWLANNANVPFIYVAGRWYHIACVVTPAGYSVYTGGVLAGSGSFTGTPLLYSSTHTITIGANGNGTEYFKGAIDELRIYNAALTPANIQADLQQALTTIPANIKNYYTFDNATGTQLYDVAAGYTGTATGNPAWVESYAMVVPVATKATDTTGLSFTARWNAPVTGTVDNNYRLDVATDSLFTNILTNYNGITVNGTSQAVTGLTLGTTYYYRVRADKTSVTGQGAVSNTISVITFSNPAITSFSPSSATAYDTVIIKGIQLLSTTGVTFGGRAAVGFVVVSDSIVKAVVPNGLTGAITITTTVGVTSSNNFTYIPVAAYATPGNTLNFNGGNVTIPTRNTTVSGSFTVEGWIRPAGTGNMSVFSSRGISDFTFDIQMYGGKTLHGDIGNGTAWLTTVADATFIYEAGKWYHIAYVITPTGYSIYTDGKLAGSGNLTGTPLLINSTHNLITLGNYFGGSMDEVKIWNSARTPAQILADRNNITENPANAENLVAYYNFDEGVASAANTRITALFDQGPNGLNGALSNFGLSGATNNWTGSYAMVVPTVLPATGILSNGFTANWAAPAFDTANNYFLDIATDTFFNNIIAGYNAKSIAGTSQTVTGLAHAATYYYRVRANKTSVPGQGINSGFATASTGTAPIIASFTPASAAKDSSVTIKGSYFTTATGVSFGSTPAASFTIVDDATIIAVVGTGASGTVYVSAPNGSDSLAGFTMAVPVINNYSPYLAFTDSVITITGVNFSGATAVSFGGVAAKSFTLVNKTTITAVVGTGASGVVSVTTPSGTGTREGFTFSQPLLPPGNALNFNGSNSYLAIPRPVSGNFTIEYWINTTQAGRNAASNWYGGSGIVDGEMPGGVNDFGTSLLGSKLCFGIGQNGGSDVSVVSTSNVNTGKWIHVAAVRDSINGLIKLYINGVLEASAAAGKNSLTAPPQIYIGSIVGQSGSTNFNGSIDELRFFNTDRSANIMADMANTISPATTGLVAYYNFDQGIASGANPGISTLFDQSGNSVNPSLNNFALTGNTGNWVESYAMVVPITRASTAVTPTGFTANWSAPPMGIYTNYLLDVATDSAFSTLVTGYNAKPVNDTTLALTLTPNNYWWRVSASKASVQGKGGYSAYRAGAVPGIISISPASAGTDSTVTIRGNNFTGVTAVSFGGSPAKSYTVIDSATIKAVVGTGSTGSVYVTTSTIIDSLAGFTYVSGPAITSFTPSTANAFATVTIKGRNFTGVTAVSFGGVAAKSFIINSDTIITAILSNKGGTSDTVKVNAIGGTAVLGGFSMIALTPPGNALNFNGINNYGTISRQVSGDFTIEYWIKTTQAGRNGTQWHQGSGIVDGEIAGNVNDFGTSLLGSKLCFGMGQPGLADVSIISTSNVNTGVWVHVAAVRDSANGIIKLYINGVLEATATTIKSSLNTPANLSIGSILNQSGGTNFNGSIDELKIYKTNRSAYILSDMVSIANTEDINLVGYYNFDEGTGGAANTGVNTLIDQSLKNNTGTLNNFGLTGNVGNWVESYAMVVPTAAAATNITGTGFTANWSTPAIGIVDSFKLDVATDSLFTLYAPGDSALAVTGTSKLINVQQGVNYWYRVKANKASVAGQGAYSATIAVSTPGINRFTPAATTADSTVTITGTGFAGATGVSFGGTPAKSFTVVNTNTIKAVVGAGSSGSVSVTRPGGIDSLGGFTYISVPVITSFTPQSAGQYDTVTIHGTNLATVKTVSFGSKAAVYFTAIQDSVIIAVVGGGTSGNITITTNAGTTTAANFVYAPKAPPGNALNLNGTSYVSIPDAASLKPAAVTVEAWVNPASTANGFIVAKPNTAGPSGSYYEDYFVLMLNGRFTAVMSKNGNQKTASQVNTFQAGRWYHVAAVFSSTSVSLYVNGVLQQATATGFAPDHAAYPVVIGAAPNLSGRTSLSIDEVKIWNTARTVPQITADMAGVITDPPSDTTLAAYYNFDAGIPGGNNPGKTLLFDQTANNNTATLNSFSLSGPTGNWIESYAILAPVAAAATNVNPTGFTATWATPAIGSVPDSFRIDIATDTAFTNIVAAYNNKTITAASPAVITGLQASTKYYYRVSAVKYSIPSQSIASNIISLTTLQPVPVITSFTPLAGVANTVVTITGANFTGAATVSFGDTIATSVTVVNATTIKATVVGGATGTVKVTTPSGTGVSAGIFKFYPALTPPGNALNFNGSNNYATIKRPVSGDFTIEYWIKTTQAGRNVGSQWSNGSGIVDGEVGGLVNDFGTSLLGSKLCFGIGENNIADVSVISISNVNTGRWVHVAAVRDSANGLIKLYINGVLEATANAGKNSLTTTSNLVLGSIQNLPGSSNFNGAIDELKIYKSNRSVSIQEDMMSTGSLADASLVSYYNFDAGTPGGTNTGITDLVDQTAGNNSGTLTNFGLSGNTGNWVESYALVVPANAAATNISKTGFTANWVAPVTGITDSYILDVAKDSVFSQVVTGYNNLAVNGTTQAVTVPAGIYWYRVRAEKASVTGQGKYNNPVQVIIPGARSFSPAFAVTNGIVTIKGAGFTGATAVTFGGTPAASFTIVNDTTITAVIGNGASGYVYVSLPIAADSVAGFTYQPQLAAPGNTLNFTGSSYVSVPTGTATVSGSYTVEAWVMPGITGSNMNILSTRQVGDNDFDMKLTGGTTIHADIGNGGGWINTAADASYKYTAGKWLHVAYCVSPAGYSIYANGVLAGSGTFSGSPTPLLFNSTHNVITIGSSGASEYFTGKIDEVKVWTGARTQAQVAADMVNTVANPASESGLVAYYDFDQGQPGGNNTLFNLLANKTSGSFTGTLTGFGLTGATGNFVESYAMVIPRVDSATAIASRSFTANWLAPLTGADSVTNYHLEVATDSLFATIIFKDTLKATSRAISNLTQNTRYYYRLKADKASVTGQGIYSAIAKVLTPYGLPVISSFTPDSAGNNVTVTIKGINFKYISAVKFGGTAAKSFTIVSDTVITVVVGTGATGIVDITSPGGSASAPGFTWIPAPVITSFTPTSGFTGDVVTITGANFTNTTALTFGGVAAASYTVVNDTTVTATLSAAGAIGNIAVTTRGGIATSTAVFTWYGVPTITSFTPASAGLFNTVTITGTNFTGATAVSFGDTAAVSFTVVNNTTITAVIGGGATGNVSVTAPAGIATRTGFTYMRPPGNAINLNGSGQYLVFPSNSNLANQFTVEAWVKPASALNTMSIFNGKGGSSVGFVARIYSGTTLQVDITSSTGLLTTAYVPFKYSTGRWYHIACAVSPTGYTVYINGNTAASGTFNGTPILASGFFGLIVGAQMNNLFSYGEYFSGAIDEVRIYNIPLTAANVQADMVSQASSAPANMYAYYAFEQPSGTTVANLADKSGSSLSGTPTFSESYAMVIPKAKAATNVTFTGFTLNWSAPVTGTVDNNYRLDIASDSNFLSFIPGYNGLVVSDTTAAVTGLATGRNYYWRVRADKSSVTGQGAYTTTKTGTGALPPVITSFTPVNSGNGFTVTIKGLYFSTATAVSFGGTAAASFNAVSDTVITVVVGSGATGDVSVTTTGGVATLAGFTWYPLPVITSFTPASAPNAATITVNGTGFTGTTLVSFGGVATTSFSVVNDTTITAVVGQGLSGNVVVTTPGGTGTKAGFTYTSPFITSFSPAGAGRYNPVTITGSGFTGTTAVTFGGVPALSFTVVNTTTINAVIGDGGSGIVAVTTPVSVATSSAFTYLQAPGNALDLIYSRAIIPRPAAISGDFTIEFWTKPLVDGTSTGSQWYNGGNIVDGDIGGVNNDFGISYLGNKIAFGIGQSGGTDLTIKSVSSLPAGRWAHVAAVRDSTNGTISLYINGVLEASAAAGKKSLTAPSVLYMGTASGTNNIYPGSIDELKMFSTNRSANIAQDMLNTAARNTPGLEAYYNFDVGVPGASNSSYTTLYEQTGKQTNGTVVFSAIYAFLSGNWSESYAMVKPAATAATAINTTTFTANWVAPAVGIIDNYKLDVATDSAFTSFVAGYNAFTINSTSQVITGLTKGVKYYYRIRAEKASVTGQGAYSNIISVIAAAPAPVITSFTPAVVGHGATVTITGRNFTGATAVSFGGTPAATFTVGDSTTITATVANGASGNVSVTAPGGTAIAAGFTYMLPAAALSGNANVCVSTSPVITFTGNYGIAPYTFTYHVNDGGDQTITTTAGNTVTLPVPDTDAGTYVYTLTGVTDSNGYGQGQNATATINVNLASTSETYQTICSSSVPYNWNGTNYTQTGDYTFTTTNAAGCDSVATLHLVVNPTTSYHYTVELCSSSLPYIYQNASYTSPGDYVRVSTNQYGCEYRDTFTLIMHMSSYSDTTATICEGNLPFYWKDQVLTAPGHYKYTVNNAIGCDSVVRLTLNVTASPTATAYATELLACYNGKKVIRATAKLGTAPYKYSIDGINYQDTTNFSVPVGAYAITVKDAAGCTAVTSAITVTQPAAALGLTAVAGTVTCGNNTITATATGSYPGYLYSLNSGPYQSNNVFTAAPYGTDTIRVKDANGCNLLKTVVVNALTATASASAAATASATQACYGGKKTIRAAAKYGTAPYRYSLDGINYQDSTTFAVAAGTYTITIKDAAGCTAVSNAITITQPAYALSLAAAPSTVTCGNNSITATATGGYPGYLYSLNNGAYQSGNVFTAAPYGTDTIRVKDANGCSLLKTVVISGLTATATATSTQACYGGKKTIRAAAKYGTAPYRYSLDGINYQDTTTFAVPAGTYTITIKDAAGCTAISNTIAITQLAAAAKATIQQTNVSCLGGNDGSITITVTGGYEGYTYSINSGAYQASNIFTGLTARLDSVRSKDINGCTTLSKVTITQPLAPCEALTGGGDSTRSIATTMSLDVKVLPNPSINDFMLTMTGGDDKTDVEIRVMDMSGKAVYQTRGSVHGTYRFGHQFVSGMYIAQILNGKNYKTIKLIKGN